MPSFSRPIEFSLSEKSRVSPWVGLSEHKNVSAKSSPYKIWFIWKESKGGPFLWISNFESFEKSKGRHCIIIFCLSISKIVKVHPYVYKKCLLSLQRSKQFSYQPSRNKTPPLRGRTNPLSRGGFLLSFYFLYKMCIKKNFPASPDPLI